MQIQSAGVYVTAGTEELPPVAVSNYHIYSSISEQLPYGFVDLGDREGTWLAHLNGLVMGSPISIKFQDTQTSENVNFTGFNVIKVEDDFGLNPSKMAGNLRIWFGHKWLFDNDMTNKAFKPEPIYKIVDKVKVPTADKKISKTEDSGSYPRYKICETSFDFINYKLAPFATANKGQPIHFFVNEMDKMFFCAFNELSGGKGVFVQQPQAYKKGQDDGRIGQASGKEKFTIGDAEFSLGYPTLNAEFKPTFWMEMLNSQTFSSGAHLPVNRHSIRAGTGFGNVHPFTQLAVSGGGTSTKILHNRGTIDAMNLVNSFHQSLDDCITLTIQTDFVGGVLAVGDSADVILSAVEGIPSGESKSWLDTSWVVKGIEHFQNPGDSIHPISRVTLGLICFKGSDPSTTLTALQSSGTFYNAPG